MNTSFFDEGQAVRVARLAKIKAAYRVSNFTADGLVVNDSEDSFDSAFRQMRGDGVISSMTVEFSWNVGVKSGTGRVVYDGNARFPRATAAFAGRTVRGLIVRSIAKELSRSI